MPNGLVDVVVGSAVEGRDLAVLGLGRREHDDGDVAPLADPPAHLQAVDVGQAEVEDHDVRRATARSGSDPLFAVGRGDHVVAAGLETRAAAPATARGRRR